MSCAISRGTILQHGGYSRDMSQKVDENVVKLPEKWLSLLIPVYNVRPYLRQCIVSIVTQIDLEGVEIILLDDDSTDGSRQLCKEICKEHDGRIQLMYHAENRGLSAARNTMMEVATGKYLWFIDSDDEMLPGAIKGLRGVLDRYAPDIVMCDYRKQGKVYSSFSGESGSFQTDIDALIGGIFENRRMHIWSKISRRELWADDLRFPVGRCFEDISTVPWLFLRARSFYHVPEPWIIYRIRPDSIMGMVSRTRGFFDDKRNDDLALSLIDFDKNMKEKVSNITASTIYAIANFCGKEYTKISYRLLSNKLFHDKWSDLSKKINRYYEMMEACSPMPFSYLAREHLRRRNIGRWVVLTLFLALVAYQPRRSRR
jgi:glycosyltransferase involved in cell wall biosynthesis